MKYFIDAFINAQMKIILIDIFDSKKACANDLPALLTVTTEIAMSSAAVYFEEQVWRVKIDFNCPHIEVAKVLHELTRSVEIPDDLRAAALDALEKRFPELCVTDDAKVRELNRAANAFFEMLSEIDIDSISSIESDIQAAAKAIDNLALSTSNFL
tara:strand:+ start:262 stop:729 length:468 start_codon:yes stop_codon:yes gene_type:complete